MRFPKPIVYFGFFLIVAATGAGIYDSFFKSSAAEDPLAEQRRMVAGRIIDDLFEKLKDSLKEEKYKIDESQFVEFKKIHKGNYVSKYLILDQELGTKKYTKEESLKKNQDFTLRSINQLTKVYVRKFKLESQKTEP